MSYISQYCSRHDTRKDIKHLSFKTAGVWRFSVIGLQAIRFSKTVNWWTNGKAQILPIERPSKLVSCRRLDGSSSHVVLPSDYFHNDKFELKTELQ